MAMEAAAPIRLSNLGFGQRGGIMVGVTSSLPISPCCSFASYSWSSAGGFQGDKRVLCFAVRTRSNRGAESGASAGRLRVDCVGWDPENILRAPQGGHIARRSFEKQFKTEAERKAAVQKAAKEELERRRVAREARIVPQTNAGLVDFFLETETQEIEYEIARCRPRLDASFFSSLKSEIGLIRLGLNPPEGAEDRAAELEALEKVLSHGAEAYDKIAADLSGAKDRLTQILSSKNKRETLLQLAGENKLDRTVLVLLDQNIATAAGAGQKDAADFMSKIRGAMVKYMTV